jgi:hypothetical protein
MTEQNAIVVSDQAGFLAPVVSVANALAAYQAKKELIDGIMKVNVDFGIIPGSSKPTLLKAGAEKATSFFGLHPVFKDAGVIEDWTGENHGGEPFFYYRRTCNLYRGNVLVVSVDGSCNSWEKQYRYRSSERVCPECGKATIIKGKAEYGGGFICYAKKGGCGAKYKDNDPAIIDQVVGQVKNQDVADIVNTILKKADKRSLVAATLIATGLSEYFTQDIEDYISGDVLEGKFEPAAAKPPVTPERKSENAKIFGTPAPTQTTASMTLEDAMQMVSKDGELYGTRSDEKLRRVRDNPKSPAENALAAKMILEDRAVKGVVGVVID